MIREMDGLGCGLEAGLHPSEKTTRSVSPKIQTRKATLWRWHCFRPHSETIFLQCSHGLEGLFRWPGTRPAPREVSVRSGDSTNRAQCLCSHMSCTVLGHVTLPHSWDCALGCGSPISLRRNHLGSFEKSWSLGCTPEQLTGHR